MSTTHRGSRRLEWLVKTIAHTLHTRSTKRSRQPYAGLRPLRAEKETTMLVARLPFDYLQHLDRHDRVRRMRARPSGSRMRRGTPNATGE